MKMNTEEAAPLTPAQLEELKGMLLAKRDALRKKARAAETQIGQGREAQAEDMDAASQATDEAEALGIADHERAMLVQIEHALAKFDVGTYGFCESSEEPIGYARLRAIPWARRTAQEEEMREKQRR
jgi:DnaK suppressor protein